MELKQQLCEKYQTIFANLKDGKSVKIKRQTVLAGDKPRPFGTLSRKKGIIRFEPAQRVPGYTGTWTDEAKAIEDLVSRELLSAFSF